MAKSTKQSFPLLEALKSAGVITDAQIKTVMPQLEKNPQDEEVIFREAQIPEEALVKAKGSVLGIPYVNLNEIEIPPSVLQLISRDVADSHRAIAFKQEGSELYVAFVDPQNYGDVQAIQFLTEKKGMITRISVMSNSGFRAGLRKYEEFGKEVEKALEVAKEKYGARDARSAEESLKGGTIEEIIKGAPVSRMVSVLMRAAVEQGASDIHIEPFGKETRVRYRIDGVLRTSLSLPSYIHGALVSRIKVLANLKLDETRIPQDGRIRQKLNGKDIDFRVSTIPVVDYEKVVMRILDTSAGVPTLEQLGYLKSHVDLIKKQIKQPHGMFLISGPTGSGKSTTLYTILSMLNSEGGNIVTLEDPVEYYIKGVNQSQVRPEIGYTFASGLRSVLRQDPNVIMVGEIRDQETAELAVHAALTGHLLFSTIHTNNAFGVVPRLKDLKVEPFLLAATLNAIVAQRLARRICPDCKVEQEIPEDVLQQIRNEMSGFPQEFLPEGITLDGPLTFYHGEGECESCEGGYQGRLSVTEILIVTRELEKVINTGYKPEDVKAEAQRQKMISLQQDGILKALLGHTTVEEVLRISHE